MNQHPATRLPRRSIQGARLLMTLAIACLAACSSVPAVHFHSLTPVDPPALLPGLSEAQRPAIVLEPVVVPEPVDRSQWLVRLSDGSLARLEQERWASPLPDEIHQALLDILTRRYGAVEARSVGNPARSWRIRVVIQRFELLPDEARLGSTWTLTSSHARDPALRCTSYRIEKAGDGMAALAAAHRKAVEELADAIGSRLLALNRGETVSCPQQQGAPAG